MLKVLPLILLLSCLMAVCVLIGAHLNLHPLVSNAVADRVLVEKAARRLTLLRGATPLKTYRVALGRAPVGLKEQEGDQRTPEGNYLIKLPRVEFHPGVTS
jgi:L,D-transpeptidase catalytic domain